MLLSDFSLIDCPPILSTEAMRNLDSTAKNILAETGNFSITGESAPFAAGYQLMKEAGAALFKKVEALVQDLSKNGEVNVQTAIFIGGGNNGGDGLVLARLMLEKGLPFTAYGLVDPSKFKNEAKLAYDDFANDRGRLVILKEGHSPLFPAKPCFNLVVDCMLGNGSAGVLRPLFAQVAAEINSWKIPVLAADAPTGYDSAAHLANEICVKANETMLFGMPRLDAYTKEGSVFGKATVAPLHYPSELIAKFSNNTYLVGEDLIPKLLPARDDFGDKRAQGGAMIIAGSINMTGAAALCTGAALRSGLGLATLAVPQTILPILQAKLSEPVFFGLPDQGAGFLQPGNVPQLLLRAAHNKAVTIGPGLSTEHSAKETILEFLSKLDDVPVVIDADALNALAHETSVLQAITAPAILTPHVREWERLFGRLPESTLDYENVVRNKAMETGKVLILKGATTFIGTPEGKVFVCHAPNSGMAKGGSGDVLTGIIVALLAQGLPIAEAAVTGVLLHSKAGRITREKMGVFSMLPSDLIASLPEAFRC